MMLVAAGTGTVAYLFTSPAVRQAIGRLVSGVVDVPVAYLDSWAESIRGDTAARKSITAAIAAEAKTIAKNDADLVNRGVERWANQLVGRQETRERVAVETLKILAEGELPHYETAPPEDFMRPFEDIAEKASSEEMVDLMARILAGEIREPGSVSRRTLATAAILDREIVATLVQVRPYLLEGDWMHVPPSSRDAWRQRFGLLASVSIASEVGPRVIRDSSGFASVKIGSKAVTLAIKPSRAGWFVDGAHLTPTGQELLALLPPASEEKVEEIALGFRELSFIERVGVGVAIERDGGFEVVDAKDIADGA